jgi:transcription elongation factor SPT5
MQSGSEEAAVWYILQRTQVLGGQSLVKSAFARSMVPGYIFVEASSISTVRDICDGFVGYRRRLKITPVNIGDAVALLKLQPFDLMLREGSWVRIKRGAYAEDLAYLYHLDMTELNERRLQRTRGTACVRVIPRIVTGPVSSPAVIRASYVNGEARPSGAEQSLKRKHGVPRAARATQRLFDPLTWPEEAAEKIHDPGTWVFRNAVYKDGLMDLRVPINPLNLGIATPSRAELRSWSLCSDEAVRMLVLHSFKVLANEFWVDDRVEVTRGDWQGRIGTVQAVEENLLSVLLWKDTLIGDEGPRQFSTMQVGIRTSSVRKLFKIGDFVEAVSEDDHPRQGFVVAIHQIDGSHSNVTIMEQSCQNEVRSSS